jgi:hypothetical protein
VSVYTNELNFSCTSYNTYPPWLKNTSNNKISSEFDIDVSLKLLIENLELKLLK